MPTLPARLASTAERWFGKPAVVDEVRDLSAGLRRVTFAAEPVIGARWTPGQEVEFRVAAGEFRHYTAMSMDRHRLDVVFHDHGTGPGAAWARGLAPGAEVSVMGPGGGFRRRPGGHELFLGDATTLGLFGALLPTLMLGSASGPSAAPSFAGAVEVPGADVEAAAALVPGLTVLEAGREPGAALRGWLGRHLLAVVPAGEQTRVPDHACLAGHAQTIQQLRNRLRLSGMPRAAIVTKPYWATGKRGL